MLGDRASGKNGILPIWELQDQDRSAEGAPNLESGGEVLAGLPNTSANDPHSNSLIIDNPMSCYYRLLLAYEALCQTNNIAPFPTKKHQCERKET